MTKRLLDKATKNYNLRKRAWELPGELIILFGAVIVVLWIITQYKPFLQIGLTGMLTGVGFLFIFRSYHHIFRK